MYFFHKDHKDIAELVYRITDNAAALILYLDVNGNISMCNKRVENVTGKTKEDITGRQWINILYHDDNNAIKQQMFKAVIEDSTTYKRSNNFEGLIVDTNNKERLISWNITPICSEAGHLEGILLIGNDITELKEREIPLKKIDETLKNIFSSIKDYSLFVVNLDGNITYFGMGFEMMFGWQKNEIIFKHTSVLYTDEDAKSKLPLILEQVRKIGKYETEIDLIKKDGQSIPVTLTVNQFLDADGKLTGYIFIAKDITERKRLEYQVFQAEKLAAIGQLAAGVAHEINNPLFVISGRLEMLLGQRKLALKVREILNIINTQTERVRKLADRLLKFSRSSPAKLEMIKINNVIESALTFLSYHKLPVYNVEIVKELAGGIPAIKGDLNLLQEVFVNLFINAYQAMPEGGKLTIKTRDLGNQFVEIRISDTGSGIPPQNLKNIFMPFFSTKKDGTGLGLSICYNIVKNHGGAIDLETQPNKGTTFIIKLPFA